MTRTELKTATDLITQAICEHMPSAAVASGWMSEVDCTPWLREMCARFPYDARPENFGFTALKGWLAEQGITAGDRFVKALREVWIKDVIRVETGGIAYGVDRPQ